MYFKKRVGYNQPLLCPSLSNRHSWQKLHINGIIDITAINYPRLNAYDEDWTWNIAWPRGQQRPPRGVIYVPFIRNVSCFINLSWETFCRTFATKIMYWFEWWADNEQAAMHANWDANNAGGLFICFSSTVRSERSLLSRHVDFAATQCSSNYMPSYVTTGNCDK